jgi:hypothetical protein
VQRDRERIGEHRDLVGDVVGYRDGHRHVRRDALGESARRVGRVADMDAGREPAVEEIPAERVVALFTRGTDRRDPARRARQPALEQHALADVDSGDRCTDLVDGADDLVAQHLWERDEGGHAGVGPVAARVHEHLFGVGAADPAQSRSHDEPIRRGSGVVDLAQSHRRDPEMLLLEPGVVGQRRVDRIGIDTEHECSHRQMAPSLRLP